MNIALFSDTYPPEINGVATSTYNLRKTLIDHGHSVLVVTTNPFGQELSYEDGVIRLPGLKLKKLYGYRASSFYSSKAMAIIASFRPDVVHVQHDAGVSIFGQLSASKLHIGSVYTFHTLYEDYAYYFTKGHFDRFARQIIRFYFRGKQMIYDEFIAPSLKTKDYLRSIGLDATISVIPTGIEFDRFDVSREDKFETKRLKKKLGIADDEFVLLSLGRIAKEKSIDVVISGYARFLKQYKGERKSRLVITGWGPAEDELKELADSLGIADHVTFTGKVSPDKTQMYYHLGDAFVSASLTETQGLTFMEAMASSLPVLARYDDNLSGTIEDGKTGFFFLSEEDVCAKLKLIMDLSAESRRRIISDAFSSIAPYSMEKFYENVYKVYSRVYKKHW